MSKKGSGGGCLLVVGLVVMGFLAARSDSPKNSSKESYGSEKKAVGVAAQTTSSAGVSSRTTTSDARAGKSAFSATAVPTSTAGQTSAPEASSAPGQTIPSPTVASTTESTSSSPDINTVGYVTNTGAKYHRAGCSYLKSSIPIALGDAARTYGPCSRCNPPVLVSVSAAANGPDKVASTTQLTPPPGKPAVAENGSKYGEISPATGKPKTTYVQGYTRKDGTHVKGHYRSK